MMNLTDLGCHTCWSGGTCHRREDCDTYHQPLIDRIRKAAGRETDEDCHEATCVPCRMNHEGCYDPRNGSQHCEDRDDAPLWSEQDEARKILREDEN